MTKKYLRIYLQCVVCRKIIDFEYPLFFGKFWEVKVRSTYKKSHQEK